MSAGLLDGKFLSRQIRDELAVRVQRLASRGIVPRLEVLVASQDPASLAYVEMKRKWAKEAGIQSGTFEVHAGTTQAELLDRIRQLNADPSVHGVLLQHPMPTHLDEEAALVALGPHKDADGITPQSLGLLLSGISGFRCATPLGMMRLLEHYSIPIRGRRALVIGRSIILGKPAALMLLEQDATVTIAHSKSGNLPDLCRDADIVVAAVGRPEMIRGEWLKPGCTVLDAGYNRVEGRSKDVGDCHFESCAEVAGFITPVPGGVGPMTVASLLSNVVDAAEAS